MKTLMTFGLSFLLVACCFAPGQSMAQKTVGHQAGEERSDNKHQMKFCWCPPGKFTMGSLKNEPGRTECEDQVDVTLTRGFWMGKYEVTQAQYQSVMGKNPSGFNGVSSPVETVSWHESTAFCQKLTKIERDAGRLPRGWEYRLPTEAQWEYACRAGTKTAYAFGNASKQLGNYGWYYFNSDKTTHSVGQKQPNAWGLYDMHGNVREWCRDWDRYRLPGGTDPEVTKPGVLRVVRGGCWDNFARFCRSAYRLKHEPGYRYHFLGFRVALVPTGQQAASP